MNKMKQLLIFFSICLLLAGCETNPVVQYKTQTVLIYPPKELMVKCESDSPPKKSEYIVATTEQKEKLLVDYGNAQTTHLRKCASTVNKIEEYVEKQKKIYNDKKTDKKD